MAHITILNLNLLYVRYHDNIEQEQHLALGPLYVTSALEDAGFQVDFRDYQQHKVEEPFSAEEVARFLEGAAPVVGFSCMANLLPFTLLAMKHYKELHPEKTLILAGVGPKSVETKILELCPWVDIIVRGEAEKSAPILLGALTNGDSLENVPGISYIQDGVIRHNPRPPRIVNLDRITPPAYHHVDLSSYTGFNVITSRGCPYECTFCSVAPVWDHKSYYRSAESVIQDMKTLHEKGGAEMILFQDEFFVSSPSRVVSFCNALEKTGLSLLWKAFGRINLSSTEMMEAMERTGCVEIRFGIESGDDRILELTKKGFTSDETIEIVRIACDIFRRVDLFYVWGYPFESMDEFYKSVFQMISFRMMGARILPSMLCLLPQTPLFKNHVKLEQLEFAPDVFPEYMVTGHEISTGAHVEIDPKHKDVFDFIQANPDIFPGFFHVDLEGNIRPKLRVLQEFGFYPATAEELENMESCGAHSPHIDEVPVATKKEIATRSSAV